ncbi:carbohydrate ABC transporter permease [Georgenia alba]|uniref:Carbohydrate ABC transporter permease n=1 Tax=Georgenia alba TaxID=2233858 RepID=A0ABW2Q4A5_9MICO
MTTLPPTRSGKPRTTTRGGRPTSARSARWLANGLTYLMLIAGAGLVVGPFVFSVLTAMKTPRQFSTTVPLSLPDPVTFENFTALFTDAYDFVVPIAVTAQMVAVLVAGQMISSVLAAYAFATLRFPGRDALFWTYLATLMIPAVVTIIPLYSMLTSAGLRNTFAGLVVPFLLGSPYAIFLLRENFRSLPTELLDAATIDGAGALRRLWYVMLPLNRPILATLLLITVVTQWNSFIWPSVIAPAPEWNVMTVATASLQTQYSGNWTLVMAATTIALAPLVILFVVFQRQITRSIGIGLR